MSERVQSLHSSSLIFKVQRDSRVLAQLGIIADSHFIVLFVDLLLCMMYYFLFYIKQDLKKKQHNTSPHFFFFFVFLPKPGEKKLFLHNCFSWKERKKEVPLQVFHYICWCWRGEPAADRVTAPAEKEEAPPPPHCLIKSHVFSLKCCALTIGRSFSALQSHHVDGDS